MEALEKELVDIFCFSVPNKSHAMTQCHCISKCFRVLSRNVGVSGMVDGLCKGHVHALCMLFFFFG